MEMSGTRQVVAVAIAAVSSLPMAVRGQEAPVWLSQLGYGSAQLHPISVGTYGLPFLQVVINGRAVKLPFDTGDMVGVSLTRPLIEELGLPRVGEWTSIDSEGRVVGRHGIFRADSVRVADVVRRDQSIYELVSLDLPGLIGPQVLHGKRFTVDYQRGLLAIADGALPDSIAGALPLVRSKRHPDLLLVRGRVGSREVLIEIDSGKSRSTVDPELARELGLPINRGGAEIEALELGALTFSVPSAKLVVLRGIDRGLPEPILVGVGSDVLRQVIWTVDHVRGVVLFQRQGGVGDRRHQPVHMPEQES